MTGGGHAESRLGMDFIRLICVWLSISCVALMGNDVCPLASWWHRPAHTRVTQARREQSSKELTSPRQPSS